MDKLKLQQAFVRTRPDRIETPLVYAKELSSYYDAKIWLKCEQFQGIGAFKIRGASNFIRRLNEVSDCKVIVTHSSGNHAQAVAFMGYQLGLEAHVVMPENANKEKVKGVEKWGANIHFCLPTIEDRIKVSNRLAEEMNAVVVPPFDHEWIIEGQATCAMEILKKHQTIDYIIAPLGGGGLLSGTVLAAKYFSQNTKVIGAEPANAADGFLGLQKGNRETKVQANTVADGLRTTVGENPFQILLQNKTEVMLSPESQIIPWMKQIWKETKMLIEPSCAVPFAAMAEDRKRWKGKEIAIIITGGNVDLDQFFSPEFVS